MIVGQLVECAIQPHQRAVALQGAQIEGGIEFDVLGTAATLLRHALACAIDQHLAGCLGDDMIEMLATFPWGIGAEHADQRLVGEIRRAQRAAGHLPQRLSGNGPHVGVDQ